MGLFGGKKGDEKGPAQQQPRGTGGAGDDEADYYDSPQETVSLSAAPRTTGSQPAVKAAPAVAEVHDEEPPRPSYGINQAIELMRALPVDQNPELVVQVIKTTLESLKVKVSDIIGDADRKTKDLEDRVANLKRAIADFEKEIETRKEEIGRLEADHKETTGVRARLELAEKAQQQQAAAAAKPQAKVKTG